MKILDQDHIVASEMKDVSKRDEQGEEDKDFNSAAFQTDDDYSSGSFGNESQGRESKIERPAELEGSHSDFAESSIMMGQKQYAKNEGVIYISRNRETDYATILKVLLDDDRIPFYYIRLHSSGKETLADGGHLVALPKCLNESRNSSKHTSESREEPQQRKSMASIASLKSAKSVKTQKAFAQNDKVIYMNSNGESENATILKAHLDDQLVPFYDIRLHSSGKEKQTDEAHLQPCRERKRPQLSDTTDKPQRHSSTPEHFWTTKSEVPHQRRSSIAIGTAHSEGFVKKAYTETDEVVYVSSNGDTEKATILKAHFDDQLVPFYDIRLHSSGREKQTDDAHLKPQMSNNDDADKPQKRNSRPIKASTDYSFTHKQQRTKKSKARGSLPPGSAHSDGFAAPFHQEKRAKAPRRTASMPVSEPSFGNTLTDAFVSPHQGKKAKAPRRRTSLSTREPFAKALPDGFVSPQAKAQRKTLSRTTSVPLKVHLPAGFVSPHQGRKSKVAIRRSSLSSSDSIDNSLLHGFVSLQETKSKAPRTRTNLSSSSESFSKGRPDDFVSPQGTKSKAPRRRTSLSASESFGTSLLGGFVSPHGKKINAPRKIKSMDVQSNFSPKPANRVAGGSSSALPIHDRLDDLNSSKRPQANRCRSFENPGGVAAAGDHKVASPVARSESTSMLGKAKKKILFQWNPRIGRESSSND